MGHAEKIVYGLRPATAVAKIALLTAFYYWLVHEVIPNPVPYWIAAACAAGFTWFGISLVQKGRRRRRDRRAVEAALAGASPRSDARTAIAGVVEIAGEPLTAPFSGKPCAAYSYDICDRREKAKTNERGVVVISAPRVYRYSGYHLTPTWVCSPGSRTRLLAFPQLQDFEGRARLDRDRARRYVESTELESVGQLAARAAIERLTSDDDGVVAVDWSIGDPPENIDRHDLSERFVAVGDEVCAIGHYDVERGGLTRGPDARDELRLFHGGAKDALKALSFGRSLAWLGVAIAVLATAAALLPIAPQSLLRSVGWEYGLGYQLLLDRREAFTAAVRQDDIGKVRHLLRFHPDLRSHTTSALLEARSTEMISLLLDHAAHLNEREGGETPLTRAVVKNDRQSMKLLLEAGARVDARNSEGKTALHLAVEQNRLAVARALIEAGASLDVVDDAGSTPLMTAQSLESVEMITLLEAAARPGQLERSPF